MSQHRPSLAELAALRLFVDTVDLGSLSAAARRHRISQPSASEALRRLERRLGVALLTRTPSGSQATADGARLLPHAREVLGAVERFATEVDAVRAGAQGRVRVSASYTNAEYVLPARIAAFTAAHPDVNVRLTVANSDEVCAHVRSGTADVGFVEGPVDTSGLRSRPIGRDELTVVVSRAHPWAARTDALPAGELAATPLLLRERASGTRRTYEAALARAGHTAAEPYGVMTSTEALKAAVRASLGATVVSALAVRDELRAGVLVAVPVAGLELTRVLRAIWLAARRSAPAGRIVAFAVGTGG
jgi:DNA-binding transcriptional LysR family regulator